MKNNFLLAVLLSLCCFAPSKVTMAGWGEYPIVGQWRFIKLLYNGQELPKPNPNLEIEFHFDPTGISRLFWFRTNEDGFCDRMAQYQIQGNHLIELITWVNPDNAAECGKDLDMQLGRTSKTEFKFDFHGHLLIRVYVADWDLWYIWEKVSP